MLRKCSVVITGFMCMVSVMLLFATSPSFAAGKGNGGNGGDKTASAGGCGSHLGSCVGGGWVYLKFKDAGDGKKLRPVKDSSGNITGYKLEEMSGTGYSFTSDIINGCGEIKGVYVSTWFYKGKKSRPIGTISNNNWNKLNGPSIYSNSAKEFDTVKARFEIAKGSTDEDGNPIIPNDVNWNNVSWFCYDYSLEGTEGEIWGTTEVSATTDGIAYDSGESTENGYAGLKISSDSGNVEVTFKHRFYLDVDNEDNISDDLYFDFEDGAGAGEMKHAATDANGNNGTAKKLVDDTDNVLSGCYTSYCGIKAAYNSAGAYDYYEHTITIKPENFTDGNTEQICSKVSYKTILEISGEDIKYETPNEDTKGCIKVQLATTPGGDPPNDRLVTNGSSSVGQMFAGEDSRLNWFGNATSMVTRRLAAYDTISYLVASNIAENTTVTRNTASRSTVNNICDYINANVSGISPACASVLKDANGNVLSGTIDNSNTDNVRNGNVTSANIQGILDSQSVVVPENYGSGSSIGAKYCTTRGYQYQYWYAHQNEELSGPDQDNDIWEQKDNRSYWYIFPSACEVIKKRPQVAIWNGSVFSKNGVETAVSNRYVQNAMGTILEPNDGNINTTYGSWVEYLGIANGSLDGLSSGAGLAIGRDGGAVAKDSLSNLTIANDTASLGNAGIEPNGAYQVRLEKYLKDKAEEGVGTELGATTVSESKILKYAGDLTINGNIVNNGSYAHSSLKAGSLPQMVIFVDGDLSIKQDVTQIDAWLIVSGNINTCSEFVPGKTSANGDCNQKLTFNGPVSSGSLSLNRTYGAESNLKADGTERDSKADAAEIFNLRPDAYIWAYNQSLNPDDSGGYDYKIVYSRELAPRY